MKWLRRLGWTAGVLAALAAAGYYPLVVHSPKPEREFPLDIAAVRALAEALPGDKPGEIRFEHVMTMAFNEAMQMAGDPWRAIGMPVYSYQLVFPRQTLIVDTAMAREHVMPDGLLLEYDAAAYRRVVAAMDAAAQIVVTHEHPDHLGGAAAHPRLAQIAAALRLTPAQLGNALGMWPLKLDDHPALADYRPLAYDGMTAIAPGVVLIQAAGHTPGSQMVYVRRADGRELLFLGDVSWRLRNIEQLRERPLFMTLLIGEDRQAVLGQFVALNALVARQPAIALVPGHDAPALQALAARGLLQAGFAVPRS